NEDGVVSLPPTDSSTLHPPTLIGDLPRDVTKLVRAGAVSCALKAGEVWCWGTNDDGHLGISDFEFCPYVRGAPPDCKLVVSGPVRAALPESAVDLTEAGPLCALGVSGRVWCWGNNTFGVVRSPSVITHELDGASF